MKIKEDFLLRKVADCYVVVPVGKATVDFNGMMNLNETGAFLWEKLENDTTKEELLKAMLDEYEVTEDIIDGEHSVIFDEAENRLHAQKAVMAMLMGD